MVRDLVPSGFKTRLEVRFIGAALSLGRLSGIKAEAQPVV